ncbi:hypothetical protein PYCC9005_002187 [Savitreella phatthalungensis]
MTGKSTVLIVGAGAVGAFYGSRLPGADVSVVCRSNYKAVVSQGGFQLKTPKFGDYLFSPVNVFPSSDAAADSGITWDFVVVTTKALPDVQDDTLTIERLVKKGHTSIVLIQNGVGVEEPYRLKFPTNPILSAVTVVSAAQNTPGTITHNRWTRISIGPYAGDDVFDSKSGGAGSDDDRKKRDDLAGRRTKELCELLKGGGIKDADAYDEADLQLVRWHKIAINASMNPSSVLSGGCGNAEMSLDPELRLHLKGVMDEVLTTAPKVLGRPFPTKGFATADTILKSTERNTSGKPSMLLDWQRGNPLEIEVILGNPVRIARRRGIEMPRTQSLYALLRMAGERRRKGVISKL